MGVRLVKRLSSDLALSEDGKTAEGYSKSVQVDTLKKDVHRARLFLLLYKRANTRRFTKCGRRPTFLTTTSIISSTGQRKKKKEKNARY